jgi:MoxR-like ATPase
LSTWPIYTGESEPHDGIDQLPDPPNWRRFEGSPLLQNPAQQDSGTLRRLGDLVSGEHAAWAPDNDQIQMINAALFLRRPLLVTGKPGSGKSTLAYSVAKELRLGPVLRWPITSRSTLQDGLYRYDAIGRLREENLRMLQAQSQAASPANSPSAENLSLDTEIGRHLRLGALGTALLPYHKPRVLLIDEIDKSDIDLPSDLLNIFEDGEYEIDELLRLPDPDRSIEVMTADLGEKALIRGGHVQCHAFPFIVMTSNAERQFPPAFLRRCLRLELGLPSHSQLISIVTAHLGSNAAEAARRHIGDFLSRREHSDLATDQLLNAIYLAASGAVREGQDDSGATLDGVIDAVMRPLSEAW